MDIYDNNINVLTNYIADGSKGCNSNAVGVELEHFVIDKNGDCVPYINGVENIIEQLAQTSPNTFTARVFLSVFRVINTTSLLNRVHKLKSV